MKISFSLKKFFSSSSIWKNPHPTTFPYKDGNKVRGIVLDLSGTLCDAHVIGPALAFVKAFELEGVSVTMEEARKPMGARKDIHIQTMLDMPSINTRGVEKKGTKPTSNDVSVIFKHFLLVENQILKNYADLIPGAAETLNGLRQKKEIKVGLTTGFTRENAEILIREIKAKGLILDSDVAGDDVRNGMGFRPAPFMIYKNMENFQIFDRRVIVKVDDTVTGVEEGLNAGVWTVGVYKYSNYTKINSLSDWKNMKKEELEKRAEISKAIHLKSGAHYVAESVKDLPEIVDDINRRLAKGESP